MHCFVVAAAWRRTHALEIFHFCPSKIPLDLKRFLMASPQMEHALMVLAGFSERLENHRVEMKRQLVEEVDRCIDGIKKKVASLDAQCRRKFCASTRPIKTENDDDDKELVPVVRKIRTKKLSTQGNATT